ncbi:MAG: fibronectin type III domain-containing protein [Bryobacteraceae bacterium]
MRSGIAAISASLVLSAGCGYMGPVVRPSPQVPNPVTNLVAVERGDGILITFTTPPRTTDKLTIKRFSEIDLRIGPAITPFDFGRWSAAAKQYLLPLPPRTDPDAPKPFPVSHSIPVSDWQGRRVAIAVRTAARREGHYSSWSNVVRLTVIPPLEPPAIEAKATAEGIKLTLNHSGSGMQYRIFRQGPGDKTPVEIGTAKKPEYTDTTSQYDIAYKYSAVAVKSAAESLVSRPFLITAVDVFPPKVPASVAALAAANSIEVSWERSPDTDLKGYYIYRSLNGGAFERQGGLVSLPTYSDHKVEHGKTYRYAVSAVDQKNNESARSAVAEVPY